MRDINTSNLFYRFDRFCGTTTIVSFIDLVDFSILESVGRVPGDGNHGELLLGSIDMQEDHHIRTFIVPGIGSIVGGSGTFSGIRS